MYVLAFLAAAYKGDSDNKGHYRNLTFENEGDERHRHNDGCGNSSEKKDNEEDTADNPPEKEDLTSENERDERHSHNDGCGNSSEKTDREEEEEPVDQSEGYSASEQEEETADKASEPEKPVDQGDYRYSISGHL
jgi:hypothetical protein